MGNSSAQPHLADIAPTGPILTKFLLFHAKAYSPLFRPLSPNVLREVCSYLISSPHSLAIISLFRIYSVDLRAMCWKPIGKCPRNIVLAKAVMISPTQAFVCSDGDRHCKLQPDPQRAWIVGKEGEVEVRPMLQDKQYYALIFDEITANVYVFGGYQGNKSPLRSAEAFSLAQREWGELPMMQCLQGTVKGCQHLSTLYLIGQTGQIEGFSVVSSTFFSPNIDLPLVSNANYLVYKDTLCLISEKKLVKWDLTERRLVQELTPTQKLPWINIVIEKGKYVYCIANEDIGVGKLRYLRLDLESAEVKFKS